MHDDDELTEHDLAGLSDRELEQYGRRCRQRYFDALGRILELVHLVDVAETARRRKVEPVPELAEVRDAAGELICFMELPRDRASAMLDLLARAGGNPLAIDDDDLHANHLDRQDAIDYRLDLAEALADAVRDECEDVAVTGEEAERIVDRVAARRPDLPAERHAALAHAIAVHIGGMTEDEAFEYVMACVKEDGPVTPETPQPDWHLVQSRQAYDAAKAAGTLTPEQDELWRSQLDGRSAYPVPALREALSARVPTPRRFAPRARARRASTRQRVHSGSRGDPSGSEPPSRPVRRPDRLDLVLVALAAVIAVALAVAILEAVLR